MPFRYWALIFVLGIGWGSSMFFNEILLRELGPFQTGLGRVGFGALGCWLWLAASGKIGKVSPAFLLDAAIFGLLQYAVPLTIFPAAQQVITSGEAGIINALTPVMVVIVSQLWPGGERAIWLKSLGVAAGFAGIFTLALPALDEGAGSHFSALLFCMLAPLCYGFAVNWFRRFGRTDPAVITAWSLLAGTLALTPVVLATEGVPVIHETATWGALFFIGFVLTAASFILLFWLLPRVGATTTSTITFITPVSAVTLGILFLGEVLTTAHIAGMALIFLGLLFIDGRIMRHVFGRVQNNPQPRG